MSDLYYIVDIKLNQLLILLNSIEDDVFELSDSEVLMLQGKIHEATSKLIALGQDRAEELD